MRGLTGKTAIVTGGAHGIGRAIAQRLCSEGVSVTFTDLSQDGAALQEEGAARQWSLQFVQGDMADEAFCRAAVAAAVSRWGGVDFLVNNAFSFLAKGMDATREDWHRMMEVGPIAYATMGQCAADAMKARGGGAIVNISSISAHIAQPNRWTYNAAKGAVNQLTRCMALDLAPYRIRVNTLSPGWIWTREVDKACGGDRARWGPVWGKYHILRRLGNVEEIAGPTAFLLSDEASFITGAELAVDGGYLALGSEGLGDTSTFAGSA
jgi:hypothetical protein